jgi:stringent starvation protein B
MTVAMKSSRPYLLRALYEWIADNHCTPYLVVNAEAPGTQVPQAYVKDGQIVLNIAPGAVAGLQMLNDYVMFSARFGGIPMEIEVPMAAVLGIYARENGQGMIFEPEDFPPPDGATPADGGNTPSRGKKPARPGLKVVK